MEQNQKNTIEIGFTINGEERVIRTKPGKKLLDLIREDLGLTGTKYSCGEGICGTCTVLMDGRPVKSCQLDASIVENKEILTIEGLSGDGDEELHPIQKAFIEAGAVQCGYCTPAMILRTKWFLEKNPDPSREEARKAISPILCRCTGYKKIIDAIMLASEKMRRE
ncbi:hypothetical protein AKJ40_00360 [candidate division MSBL1 archaeon SCGC-AAA259M10]|uniref:2Fe-2S ferredoxin-type domain-containing protein n=1 Tax=candidate division MSBL1 archaeon SCGC-AAA259M10 TaxID=1698270 RepID=A0A133V359_9EURY|nr:hypothetical protein AKJ40_00360 [candidate division MSBL1 archaeon SCGC-AAA259M10]